MFVCQKCRHPLQVDSDLPLQESAVSGFTESPMPLAIGVSPSTLKLPEYKQKEKTAVALLGESFLLLPKGSTTDTKANPYLGSSSGGGSAPSLTAPVPSSNLDKQVTALTNIFEVASDKCQYDHPLCGTCSDAISAELERRLQAAESDRKAYEAFLEKLPPAEPQAEPALSLDEVKLKKKNWKID